MFSSQLLPHCTVCCCKIALAIDKNSHSRTAKASRWCRRSAVVIVMVTKASVMGSSTTHAHATICVVRADVHAVAHRANPLVWLWHIAPVTLPLRRVVRRRTTHTHPVSWSRTLHRNPRRNRTKHSMSSSRGVRTGTRT